MRIEVIDTNVVVAGLLTRNASSPVASILDDILGGRIRFLVSPALLEEYREVLLRPGIAMRHGLSPEEVDWLLTELVANLIWREPEGGEHAPNPGDDHLWELLRERHGSTLVTGDHLLLQDPPGFAVAATPARGNNRSKHPVNSIAVCRFPSGIRHGLECKA